MDSLNLIARLPGIAAYIYRRYGKHIFLIKIKYLTCIGLLYPKVFDRFLSSF